MQWMQKIQSVLDEVNNKTGINAGAIAPAAFGGIVGALLTGKSGQKMVGNALLVGGGAALASVLWNKYSARTAQPQNGTAQQIPAFPDPRMARLITAMVFAAKSDGIIDKKEDIGIYQALGMTKEKIISIFKLEGNLITGFGALIGLALGTILCLLQEYYGFITLGNGSYIVSAYPVKVIASDILIIMITVIAIGYLASHFPVKYLVNKIVKS